MLVLIIAGVTGELVGSQDKSLSDCNLMLYLVIYAVGLGVGIDYMLLRVYLKLVCLVVSVGIDYCGSYG